MPASIEVALALVLLKGFVSVDPTSKAPLLVIRILSALLVFIIRLPAPTTFKVAEGEVAVA
jgi:hypothetical protein